MKLISFDVGIKNMAYCIFEIFTGSQITIIDWGILNLMDITQDQSQLCNACIDVDVKKKKKGVLENLVVKPPKTCGKKAKYQKGEYCFCETHAKKSEWMLPTKDLSMISIKKKKMNELVIFCKNHFLFTDPISGKSVDILHRKDLLEVISQFLEKKVLKLIKNVHQKTADETDLITIGRNMQQRLDAIQHLQGLTHVIIENQISPIANRMKTIQGMLAQYFIMRDGGEPSLKIEFISSANKLKGLTIHTVEVNEQSKYKQHKKDAVNICSNFLENNENLQSWKTMLDSPKKDDLSDCFLQGIWYLKNKNIINYAENLKINSISLS
jgi:hypothetical protein